MHHASRLRGSTVTVCEDFDGRVSLLCQGKPLDYRVLAEGAAPIPTDDEKSVWGTVEKARRRQRSDPRYKPAPDHPVEPLDAHQPSPRRAPQTRRCPMTAPVAPPYHPSSLLAQHGRNYSRSPVRSLRSQSYSRLVTMCSMRRMRRSS